MVYIFSINGRKIVSGYEYHRKGGEYWTTTQRSYNESCRFLGDRTKPLDHDDIFNFCKSSLPCQTCCRIEHQVVVLLFMMSTCLYICLYAFHHDPLITIRNRTKIPMYMLDEHIKSTSSCVRTWIKSNMILQSQSSLIKNLPLKHCELKLLWNFMKICEWLDCIIILPEVEYV